MGLPPRRGGKLASVPIFVQYTFPNIRAAKQVGVYSIATNTYYKYLYGLSDNPPTTELPKIYSDGALLRQIHRTSPGRRQLPKLQPSYIIFLK